MENINVNNYQEKYQQLVKEKEELTNKLTKIKTELDAKGKECEKLEKEVSSLEEQNKEIIKKINSTIQTKEKEKNKWLLGKTAIVNTIFCAITAILVLHFSPIEIQELSTVDFLRFIGTFLIVDVSFTLTGEMKWNSRNYKKVVSEYMETDEYKTYNEEYEKTKQELIEKKEQLELLHTEHLTLAETHDNLKQQAIDKMLEAKHIKDTYSNLSFDNVKDNVDNEPVFKVSKSDKIEIFDYSNPIVRLYGCTNMSNNLFFDTEEELMEYAKNNNIKLENIYVLDYIGEVAGRSDVIRKSTINDSTLYTPIDIDGYATYNLEKSYAKHSYIWEYNYGDLKEEIAAFRKRGIIFENNPYKEYDKQQEKLIQKIRERKLDDNN